MIVYSKYLFNSSNILHSRVKKTFSFLFFEFVSSFYSINIKRPFIYENITIVYIYIYTYVYEFLLKYFRRSVVARYSVIVYA